MADNAILVIRPVTTLGVSQLRLLERTAGGAETAILRQPARDPAPVTAAVEAYAAAGGVRPGAVIDLEFCDWVDSTGLGLWVSWLRLLEPRGGRLAVCRANQRILNVLRVSQLDQVFLMCGTVAEGALALFGAGESEDS
jgi:anti-anti-sigma factor